MVVIFRGGTLQPTDVDQLRLDPNELTDARFFDVSELARLMPDRLARRVAEAAQHDAGTYLEHGRAATQVGIAS